MRILYAADNRPSSLFNLQRFLQYCNNHTIKVAAYSFIKKSDWNLDSLLDFNSGNIIFNNNYKKYCQWIKEYSPDLIISDLEIYTSAAAIELNIPVWQASPILVYYALNKKDKDKLEIFKLNSHLFIKNQKKQKYIYDIISGSNERLIVSHFCDVENFPDVDKNFEWVRPEFELANGENGNYNCGVILNNRKEIINYCSNRNSYMLSNINYESKKYIEFKKIDDPNYFKLLGKSRYCIGEGDTQILADYFFNSKDVVLFPRKNDIECVINCAISEKYNLAKIYYNKEDIKTPNVVINSGVGFLKDLL